MNKIIDFMNWLTDIDGGWWPLIKCRPEKNACLSAKCIQWNWLGDSTSHNSAMKQPSHVVSAVKSIGVLS